MNRLLKTGFKSYFRSIFFYIALVLSIATPEYDNMDPGQSIEIELFIISIVIVWHIGREYSNGGFANKLICGYGRTKIFLSELIVALSVSFIIYGIYSAKIIYMTSLIFDTLYVSSLIRILLAMFMLMCTFVIILVAFNMFIGKRSLGIILSIILVVALFVAPEMIDHYAWVNEIEENQGVTEWVIVNSQKLFPEYHTNYAAGIYNHFIYRRDNYRYDLAIKLGILEKQHLDSKLSGIINEAYIYSLIVSTLAGVTGCMLFKKKDIK